MLPSLWLSFVEDLQFYFDGTCLLLHTNLEYWTMYIIQPLNYRPK